jgi:hypothetical protein
MIERVLKIALDPRFAAVAGFVGGFVFAILSTGNLLFAVGFGLFMTPVVVLGAWFERRRIE